MRRRHAFVADHISGRDQENVLLAATVVCTVATNSDYTIETGAHIDSSRDTNLSTVPA